MSPHCILTEHSLRAHPRKGREGNREGNEEVFPIHLPTVTLGRASRADDGWAAHAARIGGGL